MLNKERKRLVGVALKMAQDHSPLIALEAIETAVPYRDLFLFRTTGIKSFSVCRMTKVELDLLMKAYEYIADFYIGRTHVEAFDEAAECLKKLSQGAE